MSTQRHEGQDRKSTTHTTPSPPVGGAPTRLGAGPAPGDGGGTVVEHPEARLGALGADLARALLSGAAGPRTLRAIARDVTTTAGDDAQVHRTLVDVTLASQHLRRERALGAYVRSRRRAVGGDGPAAAFLDGMLRGAGA